MALHSLRLAFDSVSAYDPTPCEHSAEQLGTFRRVYRLTIIPPSDYYMAKCRTLRTVDAPSPTAVVGRKRYVTGEPYVRAKNILIIGDSGCHIYSAVGKHTTTQLHGFRLDQIGGLCYPSLCD